MPIVLNIHHPNHAILGPSVYCGRGSVAGNPFRIGKEGTRDEVCDKFEKYVEANTSLKERIIRYARGKNLLCHCAPLRCHCDYILRIANE